MTGLYTLKPWLQRRLAGVAAVLAGRRIAPDVITATGVAFAAIGGGAVLASGGDRRWLLAVPIAGVLRLVANALDGMVARLAGNDRTRGEIVNEVADRIGDLLMLGPLATVDGVPGWLVIGACTTTFLSSHVAVAVRAAAGGERPRHGVMGKPDRVLVVGIAAIAALVAPPRVVFDLALGVVIVGTVDATVTRFQSVPASAGLVRSRLG